MFGIEIPEIFLFLKQLGFAVAGASALWGAVMSRKDFHCGLKECLVYDWLAMKLLNLFFAGSVLGTASYLFLIGILPVFAHEGIAISPTLTETIAGLVSIGPIIMLSLFLSTVALVVRKLNEKMFSELLTPFLSIQFIIFFIITALPALTGELDARQIFFIGHGFHSIFTLGSVLVLDFLFLSSKRAPHLVEHVVPLFPTISKVIWLGFGFDLLSAIFILPLVEITPKLIFMQSVVGVLLINGAILSGPIGRKIMESFAKGKTMSKKWERIADICGTISISSWLTITAVDAFENLSLTYLNLASMYVVLILILYLGHTLISQREKKFAPPKFIH